MNDDNNEIEHKKGSLNVFLEHKFFILSISYIMGLLIYKRILNNPVPEEFLVFSVIIATLFLLYSLFLELPHSRYLIFQIIGHLAWYIAIGSALFMGWSRWINTD